MVFQDPLLFDATVAQNIATGLKLRGVPAAVREPAVRAWAQRLGIGHLLDRSARQLSGGEAQRTALARAFVLGPEILFLDEPFASLDAPAREGLLDDLGHILAETGSTAVISTHDQGEAARLAHRLAVMKEGTLLQIGGLREVMNHPQDPFVAAFVGMETLLKGQVTASGEGLLTLRLGKGSRRPRSAGHGRSAARPDGPGGRPPRERDPVFTNRQNQQRPEHLPRNRHQGPAQGPLFQG